MEYQRSTQKLFLVVDEKALHYFTTALQSGIELLTNANTSVGDFLCNLKGFTPEYIATAVETIFLNGLPVDDLDQQLTGENPVLALSAAMPGLAGAIFRKNSFHSALRSVKEDIGPETSGTETVTVRLKLFNSVAKERGADLLQSGVTLPGRSFADFLRRRPNLIDSITLLELDKRTLGKDELLSKLEGSDKFFITINGSNG